jgi:thiamine transporter
VDFCLLDLSGSGIYKTFEEENTMTRESKQTIALVETAVLVALAFALSCVRFKIVDKGGAITAASMLPILIIGIRRGLGWGLGGSFVYSLLQALQDHALAPPASGIENYILMILLDYVIAFGALGLSGLFRHREKGLLTAIFCCLAIRYASHVLSGIILWGSYAWKGWPVVPYSFAYNATYMVPELIITYAAARLLLKYLPRKYLEAQ